MPPNVAADETSPADPLRLSPVFAQRIGGVVCFFEQAAHHFWLLSSVGYAMVSEIEAAARGVALRRRL
jgi:hypothetical protein